MPNIIYKEKQNGRRRGPTSNRACVHGHYIPFEVRYDRERCHKLEKSLKEYGKITK